MPTNDERREVARRLRDNAGQKPGWVIPWAAFNDAYEHEGAELINRLADLIEPEERTCGMIDNGVELCCSECDGRHSYDDEPDYCMRCGAKVVDV